MSVKWDIVRDESDTFDIIRHYSDENFKLKQVETEKVYGRIVTDEIIGYNDGKPYGRYTYEETDEKDEDIEGEKEEQI